MKSYVVYCVVADDNTAVYEVFRAHFDQLVTAMGTSPTALIPVLYAKKLISGTDKTNLSTLTGVGNIDKATMLLTAVETTMKAEPRAAQVVRKFCEAVNNQPALRHVADRITTALGETLQTTVNIILINSHYAKPVCLDTCTCSTSEHPRISAHPRISVHPLNFTLYMYKI